MDEFVGRKKFQQLDRKKEKPKLKIQVENLPPSKQSSTRTFGQKVEKHSAPGKKVDKILPGFSQPKRSARKG